MRSSVMIIFKGKKYHIQAIEIYDAVYNKLMKLTDGDFVLASDAAIWSEIAAIGDKYEFDEGLLVKDNEFF